MIKTSQTLAQRLATTTAGFFLREFSISNGWFVGPDGRRLELADQVVCFDDVLLVLQLKQRSGGTSDPSKEAKWFHDKVEKKATAQIRSTLEYLRQVPIVLSNDRGHRIDLTGGLERFHVYKLVVYESVDALPTNMLQRKGHASETVGFIHLINSKDYEGILHTLVTLPEVLEYLAYRESVSLEHGVRVCDLPEQDVLGSFLIGDDLRLPTRGDAEYLARLDHEPDDFQMFGILQTFEERIYRTIGEGENHYYKILRELMLLPRGPLAAFKKRFTWAWDKSGGEELEIPTRGRFETGCGFVLIPIPGGREATAERALENLTVAAKYDLQVDRCVGLTFVRDGTDRLVTWMMLEHPWKYDPELDRRLRESYPFRQAKTELIPQYKFRSR